jgi:diamine N-acetyltransferase
MDGKKALRSGARPATRRRSVARLSVSAEQQRFVASNAVSLAEALFHREAWFRAIHVDESPAGFAMPFDESLRGASPAAPTVALWRFMVDARFQRQGVGKAALALVIAHVRSKRVFSSVVTSYVPGPGCPEAFYLGAGFRPTGEIDDGEIVLALPLSPIAARPFRSRDAQRAPR